MSIFKKKNKSTVKTGFVYLKVKEVTRETADAVSIHFEQPKSGHITYQSGQFFTVTVEVNGKEERRAYSLCSSPYTDACPAVAVKRVANGVVSNYLNDHVKAGDTLKLMEPNGNFTTEFHASNSRHLLLFGGGSGITPLISLAKSTLSQEPNSRVTLVYANRDVQSIIFNKTINKLAKDERFEIVHVLETPKEGFKSYKGYLNQDIVREVTNKVQPETAEFFICGPAPMMEITIGALKALGIADEKIRKESFVSTAPNHTESPDELTEKEVTIIYDGESYKYTVAPNETILEKGLEEEIDLPFSCQSGLCTACRGKCLSGKVKMDEEEGLSESEREEGYVLPCVSHPLTDDVVIEIG